MKYVVAFIAILRCTTAPGQDGPFSFTDPSGTVRDYWLHLPADAPEPCPLVFALHGWGGDGEGMMEMTAFNYLADVHGFAVCYPTALIDGDGQQSGATSWNTQGMSDVDFLLALLDELIATASIDPAAVFSCGFSYGGEMSHHLARCQPEPRIRAIAPVGGAIFEYMEICGPQFPVSVLIMHGTSDDVMLYDGGDFPGYGPYYSAPQSTSMWAVHNGCTFTETVTLPDLSEDGQTTTVDRYTQPGNGTKVWLYTVAGGGHEWYASPPYGSQDFWASEDIWEFFACSPEITTNMHDVEEFTIPAELLFVTDLLGRRVQPKPGELLLHHYSDGTVEKRIQVSR